MSILPSVRLNYNIRACCFLNSEKAKGREKEKQRQRETQREREYTGFKRSGSMASESLSFNKTFFYILIIRFVIIYV